MPDKIQSPTPLSNLLGELMTPITTYRQNIDTLSRERQQIEQGIISRYSDCTLSPLTVSQIRKAENARAYCENCAGYPCRKPSSKGFKPVIKVKDGAVHIASEICQYARREREQSVFRRKFSSAKIPNPYVGKTFGDYETDKTNNEAVAWAHNAVDKGEGVYLHGDQGCGKTFLAAIIAQVAVENHYLVAIQQEDHIASRASAPASVDFSAALNDVEFEILKYDEIDGVSIVGDKEAGTLVIRLFVNDGADEKFEREIREEAVRILIRAMADNCELPALVGEGSFLSRLRVSVILIRKNAEQALPAKGRAFLFASILR